MITWYVLQFCNVVTIILTLGGIEIGSHCNSLVASVSSNWFRASNNMITLELDGTFCNQMGKSLAKVLVSEGISSGIEKLAFNPLNTLLSLKERKKLNFD